MMENVDSVMDAWHHGALINEHYFTFPGTSISVCMLQLTDGRRVVGVSPTNLNTNDVVSRMLARNAAIRRWQQAETWEEPVQAPADEAARRVYDGEG